MSKRVISKIGDIFYVALENGNKKYFQYIANDLTQLNSDVIRVYKKEYSPKEEIDYTKLLSGEIDFHALTMINLGMKLAFFHKESNSLVYPDINSIMFRDSNDYGEKINGEPIKISNNWHIWQIGDRRFTKVGKLVGEYRKAEIGVVIPPYAIVERIKTGQFNFVYPSFE